MEIWKFYALAAALFAGLTSGMAKLGLNNVSADLGLAIRTFFVFGFVLLNTWLSADSSKLLSEVWSVSRRSIAFLGLSAFTTALSWICYHRAVKEGPLTQVALADKSSVLVTMAFSALLLGEQLTPRMMLGTLLILAGLLTLVWSR